MTRTKEPLVQQVRVTDDDLIVELVDGRTVTVPIAWFPRLLQGNPDERSNWRLIGRGEGVHWPDLDENIRVEDLLAGHGSGETQESLRRWLQSRERAGRMGLRNGRPGMERLSRISTRRLDHPA